MICSMNTKVNKNTNIFPIDCNVYIINRVDNTICIETSCEFDIHACKVHVTEVDRYITKTADWKTLTIAFACADRISWPITSAHIGT